MQAAARADVELIDRSTRYTPLQAHAVHCSRANETGRRTGRPAARARPRSRPRPCPRPARPVALLPELRRIVTGLDMPALRASAQPGGQADQRSGQRAPRSNT